MGRAPGHGLDERGWVPVWYKRSVRHVFRQGLLGLTAAIFLGIILPIGRDWLRPTIPSGAVLSALASPAQLPPGSAAVGQDQGSAVPARGGATSATAAQRASEVRLGEAWPTPPALLAGYVWPLPNGRITNSFGYSWASDTYVNGQRFHDGLDLATFCGGHVLAAHDGTVVAAGRRVDPWMGWVGSLEPSVKHRDLKKLWGSLPIIIVIDDGNGYRSIYAHFNAIVVGTGQRVRAGQFIGYEGSTGFASGCHLHYGLFSPLESRTIGLRPDVARQSLLPRLEIARIDPLLVLPARAPPDRPVTPDGSSPPGQTQATSGAGLLLLSPVSPPSGGIGDR